MQHSAQVITLVQAFPMWLWILKREFIKQYYLIDTGDFFSWIFKYFGQYCYFFAHLDFDKRKISHGSIRWDFKIEVCLFVTPVVYGSCLHSLLIEVSLKFLHLHMRERERAFSKIIQLLKMLARLVNTLAYHSWPISQSRFVWGGERVIYHFLIRFWT